MNDWLIVRPSLTCQMVLAASSSFRPIEIEVYKRKTTPMAPRTPTLTLSTNEMIRSVISAAIGPIGASASFNSGASWLWPPSPFSTENASAKSGTTDNSVV